MGLLTADIHILLLATVRPSAQISDFGVKGVLQHIYCKCGTINSAYFGTYYTNVQGLVFLGKEIKKTITVVRVAHPLVCDGLKQEVIGRHLEAI